MTRVLMVCFGIITALMSGCSKQTPTSQLSSRHTAPSVAPISAVTPTPKVEATSLQTPRLGRCYMESCSWSVEKSRKTVQTNKFGRLIEVSLLGGESHHSNLQDYPSRYAPSEKIHWNSAPHTVFVLCSKVLPAVLGKEANRWGVDALDFVAGPPGVLESSVSLYMSTCHEPGVDWASKGFVRKYGYQSLPDSVPESVSSPEEIFQYATPTPVSSQVSRGTPLPDQFLGTWETKKERCGEETDSHEIISVDGMKGYETEFHLRNFKKISDQSLTMYGDDEVEGNSTAGHHSLKFNQDGTVLSIDGVFMVRCLT